MDTDSFFQESNKENPIKRLIALLHEYNLSAVNLFWRQYLPLEIEKLYDQILEETGIDDIAFNQELKKHHQIDLSRLSRSIYWDIEIIRKQNLVLETYPDISFDKYGLVKLGKVKHLNENGFFFNNKHNLIFPKIISRNFNLTQRIMKFQDEEVELSFLITNSELGLTETKRELSLKAHWWGPKTIEHIKEAFKKSNVVVKGNDKTKHFNVSDKVDFHFFYNDKKREYNLKVEETIPYTGIPHEPHEEINGVMYEYYTRYAHAILNKDMDECKHLDLSIKSYDTLVNYQSRSKTDITKVPKNAKYLKLIKLDSPEKKNISYHEIIGLYFVLNPYTHEMFDGESDSTREIERIREGILYSGLEKLGMF